MADPETPSRSRLARESSAYLRAAAEQPIEWYPWGTEAFELARRTGRPVLLDIGAAWCHWCHVMDEGTYADAEVARLLRQHFVAVKVDRDERPEVDQRFQRQVSALTGEGGWPLTAFLTPDGEAFYGGTYFPPTDGHGRPGFRRLLGEIARIWREEPERVRETTGAIREAMTRLTRRPPSAVTELAGFPDAVLRELRAGFDPGYGGFGGAPKFPHPIAVELLLWEEFRTGSEGSGREARETLLAMADGGMYDQLGGGFHRYSVDERWRVPHFEKMGVDNAELLVAYVEGFRRFAEPRFEEVVRGTIDWSHGVLGEPAGGWGSSQDADNAPGDDGSYFTWSRAEMLEALGPADGRLAIRALGVGTDSAMPHDPDRHVLYRLAAPREAAEGLRLDGPPEVAYARVLAKLRAVRAQRAPPAVDRALYAGINGRFVQAYALAGALFDEPGWLAEAARVADRWLAEGFDEQRGMAHLLRADGAVGHGLLDDQVAMARGLIELGIARSEPRYVAAARALLALVDREYRGEDGLPRAVAPSLYDGPQIGTTAPPSYPIEDTPHLSAGAAAALAFLRLADATHDDAGRAKAEALLRPIASRLGGAGLFAAGAALAAGLLATPPVQVVIEGVGPRARALGSAAQRVYHPRCIVFAGPPPAPFTFAGGVPAAPPGGARALVCSGTSCAPPVAEASDLPVAIRAAGRGGA